MNTPADGPPIVPGGRPPLRSPDAVAVPVVVESRWTKTARAFAIARDIVLILVFAFLIYFGSAILSRLDTRTVVPDGVSGQTIPECTSPSVDQWGTFCPETPGG